jgi:hypothetical protein
MGSGRCQPVHSETSGEINGPPIVAIVGGSPVTGNALASLLRSADYGAQFISENLRGLAELPGRVGVALVMPSSSARRSEDLINRLGSVTGANLPIIELVTTPNGQPNNHRIHVSWPCSVEELRLNIKTVLTSRSQTDA